MHIGKLFDEFSSAVAKASGRPLVFALAAVFIIAWASAGPLLHFSDTWQLIVNTVSSIVTFLMVFLIQNTQARDSEAMQAKLDELIRAVEKADERYIALERLPDREIEAFRERHGPHAPDKVE